jgi:hypothetical protein
MATNITAAFIKQYSDEVHHLFQQKGSKLKLAVRNVTGVIGSTYDFHVLGAASTNTKTRDGNLTFVNPAQTVATATLADRYAPIRVDKLDELKTNASIRQEYVASAASAMGRWVDSTIITALNASNTDITTLSGRFTQAKILEALTLLNGIDAAPEDRYMIVSAAQISDALGIEGLTSADYQTVKAMVNGQMGSALGFNFVMSNLLLKDNLNGAGGAQNNTRHCFAVHKPAAGLAIGQDVQTTVQWSPDAYAWNIVSSASMGAAVIEAAGVIEIGCVE